MSEEKITAYKAFNEDWTCRGFQYEVGKTYEHDGEVSACDSGFHACENPLDCLTYYDVGESKFAVVTQEGELSRHGRDTKVASAKITIDAELALPDFIKAAVNWMIGKADEKTPGDYSNLAASGYDSKLAASGYGSKLAASGDYSKLAASGYGSKLAASGDYSNLAASGDDSKLAASGYGSTLAASGNYSKLAASGDYSNLAASGNYSTVAAASRGCRAKAGGNGAICLAYHDGERPRFAVGYVGEDGIKADTWYRVENGKLTECE